MIEEIYKSDNTDIDNIYSDNKNDNKSSKLSNEQIFKHAWNDIVEYCRSFDEGQINL